MGPAAKKLLNEKNLEISSLKPSTKKGVVTKEDVIKASEPAKQKEDTAQTEILGSSKRVPMTRLRSVVAKRLLESQSQTASLTTFNEVDLFEVKKLREKYRDSFEEKFGVKLGFMGMFMKASSIALQEMPIVNASIDGDDRMSSGLISALMDWTTALISSLMLKWNLSILFRTKLHSSRSRSMLSMITSLTGPESWTRSKGLAPKLMIEQIRRKFIVTAE